jgi:PhnB protein
MRQLHAYLFFDGQCAEALRFYEKVLGGKLETLVSVGESPIAGQFPASSAGRILHASLRFDGNLLHASDWISADPYPGMKGVRLALTCSTSEESTATFEALTAGGQIQMPLQKTFWSEAFGMCVDRFGAPWQVTTG